VVFTSIVTPADGIVDDIVKVIAREALMIHK
jgi:hypothetical protein